MKTLLVVFAGIMLCMVAACNNAEPPRIGVVDLVKTVNESNPGKKANAELDALVKAKQTEIKEKADAVENLKKNLEKEPAATKKAKEEEFAKANAEYQQLVAASDAEVKKRAAELRGKVLEDLKKVLDAIGSEDKLLVILTSENLLYYQKTIDISDKVLKKYNEAAEGK
jgi:outer membrane protein